MEFKIGSNIYRLHGRGCFFFGEELFLDWDFGCRTRWCGIDPYMIGMTLKENKSRHVEYFDGVKLKEACEKAVQDGEMIEKKGLYHYSIPVKETFRPCFPRDFDTLIIRYRDNEWILPRNKVIDRFIRKSNRLYNEIYNSQDFYHLSFILEGKEIYSIPYDEICYPDHAIRIMSDDIIRNIKRESL